ncbi:hypothetical protein COLO4_13781 [Corchorus olitorius]|uniref:HTH myb-type domain-containing protein n=1 Tax=Corchorus olitorius TaxID=93759 RepID=A0A1R3JUT9_9ROSI|nr:hypothetical protein COLO4_13781 [Corchorus olitorius]
MGIGDSASTTEREEFGEMDDWFSSPSPSAQSLLKKLLSHDKDNDPDTCLLKKACIICSIQDRVADGSIPEDILDSLLLVEQVDRTQGLAVSDSMRAAFTAVALHCTLSFLPLSWYSYYDAVRRIWGLRLQNLEDSHSSHLIGPELAQWRTDVEAALWDSEASQRLLRLNTRRDALHHLRVYLKEARSLIKPAFLRLAFLAPKDPVTAAAQPIHGAQLTALDEGAQPTAPPDEGPQPTALPEEDSQPTAPLDKSKIKLKVSIYLGQQYVRFLAGVLRVNSQKGYKLDASRRHNRGRIVITDLEDDKPSCSNYGSLSTAEVSKLQDALISSIADLLDVVTDPLPDALKVAEMVASVLEERNKNKDVHASSVNPAVDVPGTSLNPNTELARATGENLNARATADNHSKDKSVPPPSIHPTCKPAQAGEENRESRAFIHQNKEIRPSLMERNGTARTYEWEDSIDVSGTSSCSERCRLPSPKAKFVSPLKVCEHKRWTKRRKRRMWSPEEEQALFDGVAK